MASMTFDGKSLASVRSARQFVQGKLDAAGLPWFPAVLLTSELASNVVFHACTDFDVVITIDDLVTRIELHDGLAVTEAFKDLVGRSPSSVEVTTVDGRGLLLVGSMATQFGLIDKGSAGKAMWFEVEHHGATHEHGSPTRDPK